VVTGTIGCDPLFATQYRQTLRPAPTLDCVAATLTDLPVVAAMNKLGVHDIGGEGPGYRVTLRDSGGIEWPALVTRQPRPDSAVRVMVTYFYMGFDSPNAAQRKQMAHLARTVLAAVHGACAPKSPGAVECHATSSLGIGQRGACRAAG